MLVPGRLLADPYKAFAFIRVLPEIRDYGRLLADPYRAYTLIRVLPEIWGYGRIRPYWNILYNFIFIETQFAFCFR